MQKIFILGTIVAIGLVTVGWVNWGTAQPKEEEQKAPASRDKFASAVKPPELPEPAVPTPGLKFVKDEVSEEKIPSRSAPKPRPTDDPFIDPVIPPVTKPVADEPKVKPPKIEQPKESLKILEPIDGIEVKLPEIKSPDVKPPVKTPAVEAPTPVQPKAEEKEITIPKIVNGASRADSEKASAIAKQDPSISIEWIGPSTLKAGVAGEYTLMVRNTCAISLQKVIVQVRVPVETKFEEVDPKPEVHQNVLLWELGTFTAKQEKALKLKFVPPAKGEMNCQAWVTFTGSSSMKIQVRDPKIAIKSKAPEKLSVGDEGNIVFTVSNPGDCPVEQVKLAVHLTDGLESPRGKTQAFDVGTLPSGESRTVTIAYVAKTPGAHKCEAMLESDSGVKANESVSLNVIQSRLDLEITGPKLRYIDRKAVYAIKVTNPSEAIVPNVMVSHIVPEGFKFSVADNSGQYEAANRCVKWFVGELGPRESKEVKVELVAISAGDHTHKVIVTGVQNSKTEKDIATKVEGLSALLMEVVDTEDPVEVKSDTCYEIRITNTGSKMEGDVKLTCTIPAQFKFKSAKGPAKYEVNGDQITFEPIPTLAARADATYKIVLTAIAKGDARFKASLTSSGLTEPVLKQESTRVYED